MTGAKCTWRERRDNACAISLICNRCGFCLLHCKCPPADQRAADPESLGKRLVDLFIKRKV